MNTYINIFVVLYILALHFIADFIFQTDKMAQGKSKNWSDLIHHTVTYSCIVWIGLGLMMLTQMIINNKPELSWTPALFGGITFVFHTTQDYITSRINSRLWKEGKVHWFFVSIGFDQLLHFIQLLLTYQLLAA